MSKFAELLITIREELLAEGLPLCSFWWYYEMAIKLILAGEDKMFIRYAIDCCAGLVADEFEDYLYCKIKDKHYD